MLGTPSFFSKRRIPHAINRLFLFVAILLISAMFFIGTIAPVLQVSTVANPDLSAEILIVDGGGTAGGGGTCTGSGC